MQVGEALVRVFLREKEAIQLGEPAFAYETQYMRLLKEAESEGRYW